MSYYCHMNYWKKQNVTYRELATKRGETILYELCREGERNDHNRNRAADP